MAFDLFNNDSGQGKGFSESQVNQQYKVFDGKTFSFHKIFFDRSRAEIRGEELKISGDIKNYRVKKVKEGGSSEDDRFALWIH